MSRQLLAIVTAASIVAAPSGAVAAAAAATEGARLTSPFRQCRLTDPLQIASIEAECATISIAETDVPGSRRIRLSVARLPAINRQKQTDPIVLLAGGPGQGAQLAFTSASSVLSRAGRERDILLLDQRGTGRSNELSCATEGREGSSAVTLNMNGFVQLNERCRERLAATNDLGAYTTSRAVRDLDAVRALLGYERLNLYGVSYGTRVAQHYARRYPQHVRSMVLDGVIAPETVLGPGISLDAQAALDGIWRRCSAEKSCSERFGDLVAKTRELKAKLRQAPQRLQVAHPRTSVSESIDFGVEQLAIVLRFGSYDANFAAMLPFVVSEAARGNFAPIATLFLMTTSSVQELIALGMHNSVICNEDLPRFGAVAIDRTAIGATYLGTDFIDGLPAICRNWPRGLVDPDFNAPLLSDVPTLLLSGTLDPVTPPRDAELVHSRLRNSRHLVVKGAGHGQFGVPCMDRVLADFFGNIDPKALDARCIERRLQPPFWISIAGPAP